LDILVLLSIDSDIEHAEPEAELSHPSETSGFASPPHSGFAFLNSIPPCIGKACEEL
jgi:hypothetical protein